MVAMSERKIVSVSLPRSGHNMLMRILERYLRPHYHYCESYTVADCCRTIPCQRQHGEGAVFIQKTHDFGSDTPILPDQPYLVQVRHIVPAFLSYYDLMVRHKGPTARDSIDHFRDFAIDRLRYYKSFFERWVYGATASTMKLVVYERMLSRPIDEIVAVARFVVGDGELDLSRLRDATEEEQISPQQDIRQHRHYDPEILRFLENEAERELDYLGLPKLF